MPGMVLQIRDPETREPLGPNERGEICVKSQALFHSYYKNPEVWALQYQFMQIRIHRLNNTELMKVDSGVPQIPQATEKAFLTAGL